ncbi:GNAT family N-acetyltransferase [Proteiniphilum acetatigenes]|uniref:GNAT family N-acetyltransferase n=1 Tax=Proteiniphilum acetatigenes TaxID=294710 RepID=UPI0008E6030C|nr:GNAT family N-acetyltransferase [Proteiniphilum acetatigenes]SFK32022.1 phosphinothricin acetyltransferase [Porphyromonadaceae bacterium KH3CP3RA]
MANAGPKGSFLIGTPEEVAEKIERHSNALGGIVRVTFQMDNAGLTHEQLYKMNLKLIDLKERDFGLVKEIYDHYILNSTATFHTDFISIDELKSVILIAHPKYRSFLIDYEGETCGYCYISQFKKRQAYDRTAEVTIYLKPEYSGKGIGKETLKLLEPVAKSNGISVLMRVITGENRASIGLFEKCGYEKCAHFKKVGGKFDRLLDVVAYQKIIIE